MKKITLTILLIATTMLLQAQAIFINELHYDNAGSDVAEGFEIAGPAGTDLSGWKVELYNGSNGTDYGTINLSGTIPDEGAGFGTVWFLSSGMQNGAPDGLALIDAGNTVIQFLSYEGSFAATSGAANGMTSTDIGVSEPSSTPVGESLQLMGTGSLYTDFTWSGPVVGSSGLINAGQTFAGSGSGSSPMISCPADITVNNVTGTCGAAVSFVGLAMDAEDGDISSLIVATPASGSTFPVGVNTVTLSVTDSDNNNSTCQFLITVIDNEAPVAICQNITVELDPITGMVTVAPSEVDNGSSDLCGAVSLSLDVSTFDCSMVGANSVTLTVTDAAGNSSNCSATVTVQDTTAPIITCLGEASGASVFINEIHYDNAGTDEDEGVEVAGPSGTVLSTYSLVFYNGSGGTEYNTVNLSGTIDDEGNGFGAVNFEIAGIQNGSPDAIALVNNGNVIQFLSYEGSLTAVDGVAAGLTSTDIGVSEPNSTPIGESLQLSGTGTFYPDFTWNSPTAATPGTLNVGQTYVVPTSSSVDVFLDANGMASIDPNTLLQSVEEACNYTTTVNGNTTADFTCSDLGEKLVEVTVTDDSGNAATCFATVNVIDNIAPVITCGTNPTVSETEDFEGTTVPAGWSTEILAGVADWTFGSGAMPTGDDFTSNAAIFNDDAAGSGQTNKVSLSSPVYGLTDATNVLVGYDVAFQESGDQTFTVEVYDGTAWQQIALYDADLVPNIQTESIDASAFANAAFQVRWTFDDLGGWGWAAGVDNFDLSYELAGTGNVVEVELGPDGTTTIDPYSLLSDIVEACGISTIAVDVTTVSCADIGTPIMITVFVSDASGNIASCTAEVNVVDKLAPVITCPADQTVDPGAGGLFYILPDYFATGEATAVDNCTDPVTITSQSPAVGTPLPDGTHTITLTAEDEYGNVSTCSFVLTVETTIGVGKNSLDKGLALYPNPASNVVNLVNKTNISLEKMMIYDINGKLVNTTDLRTMQGEKAVDVSSLASGVYVVQIIGNNASTVKRLIKE
ncbi:HYR domain-containing protein [Aequorivita sublithincola DSM 14238]|uniref:HYR domain-containing protein n=1 Tax=Aequorivita sublithincola (strain DSM 14238 / LMG 21431 / ACAM 643 / 9-3) TaxID=746697 RepID=I3YS01_AEQSU|nr:HYR domain-containing protein [Aequorivita sublithincola]AFL79769.1 HYR domain-containing protein [Aequorivita sublithincola DSM 14238]